MLDISVVITDMSLDVVVSNIKENLFNESKKFLKSMHDF